MGAHVRGRSGLVASIVAAFGLLVTTPAAYPVEPPSGARATPPVTMPAHPNGLPAQADWGKPLEPLAGYEPQLACAAAPLPGTAALRDLILRSYARGSDGGAIRSCAVGGQSEHKEGRAWDWMLDVGNAANRQVAGDFLAWLLATRGGQTAAMARRLGVMYVIYNRKIWATYSPGWRDYSSGDPHTSHIHISLSWNGARGTTSFWNGSVPRTDYGTCAFFSGQPAAAPTSKPRTIPCPEETSSPRTSSRPFAWLGNSGDHVRRAQRLLHLDANGTFGAATRNRLIDYQVGHDLPRTGALDEATWASLDPASRSQSVPDWTPAAAAEWGQGHRSPRLHRSSAGKAVYAVQAALGMADVLRTGYFGKRTVRAVVDFRSEHALPSSPRVTAKVWAALPA